MGMQVTEFLLLKQGKTWDSVAYPNIVVDDLEMMLFVIFVNSAKEADAYL